MSTCMPVCVWLKNFFLHELPNASLRHGKELHKRPRIYSSLPPPQTHKEQHIKMGSRRTKWGEELLLSSPEATDAFPSFISSLHNSKVLHQLLTKMAMPFKFLIRVKWVPVTTAWRVLRLRMEERPPVMEASCKYIE
jgi:hypothetical protein